MALSDLFYCRRLPTHLDRRGLLGVLEQDNLPFPVRRLYFLSDVPEGAVRGEHGHKQLEQLIFCLSGAVEISISDGSETAAFTLSSATEVIHLKPGLWRSLRFVSSGAVVVVLASREYEPDDYIHNFDEYRQWAHANL